MKVTRLSPEFGARIEGIRVANCTDSEFDQILAAWRSHRGVMVLPNQHLTDQELLDFSKRFGELDPPPNQENGRQSPDGYPDLYVVSNIKDMSGRPIGALGDGEAVWHTDMSYLDMPPLASMLMAKEIPSAGGSTWFCDMIGAYHDLPAPIKTKLKGAQIKHDGTYNSGGYLRAGVTATDDPVTAPGKLHPAVTWIEEMGEPALYLGRRRMSYVWSMAREASEAFLDELWGYAAADHRVYKHQWALGDLVVWDNRVTMHRRDPFPSDQRRLMHRSQIKTARVPVAFAG